MLKAQTAPPPLGEPTQVPTIDRYLLAGASGGAERAKILRRLSDTWLSAAARTASLSDRLAPLEERAVKFSSVLHTAASRPRATTAEILEEVVRETQVPSGEGDKDERGETSKDATLGKEPAPLSSSARQDALVTMPFRQLVLDLASFDLTTQEGRANAIGASCNRDTPIAIRLILKGESSLAKAHGALTTLASLTPDLEYYVSRCQAIDLVTGKVPTRAEGWSFTGPAGKDTQQFDLFVRCKLRERDVYNPPSGLYALKQMFTLRTGRASSSSGSSTVQAAQYKRLERCDFYCSLQHLKEYEAWMNRELGSIGVPTVLPPPEAATGFTMSTWLDTLRSFIERAVAMPSDKLMLDWLQFGSDMHEQFLLHAERALAFAIFGPEPAKRRLGALMARDAHPSKELTRKIESWEKLLESTEMITLTGFGESSTELIDAHSLPLISELRRRLEGNKRKAPGDKPSDDGPRKSGQPPKGAPPGSLTHEWMWLGAHNTELIAGGRAWNISQICTSFSVAKRSKCWPRIVSRKAPHNLAGLCADKSAEHKGDNGSAHQPIPGFDPSDNEIVQKYSRALTADEKTAWAAHWAAGAATGRGYQNERLPYRLVEPL